MGADFCMLGLETLGCGAGDNQMHKDEVYQDLKGEQGDSAETFGNQRGFQVTSATWEHRDPSAEQARAQGGGHSKVTPATQRQKLLYY